MRNGGALVVGFVVALAGTPAAVAEPSDPIRMSASGGTQESRPFTYTSTRRTDHRTCVMENADGVPQDRAGVPHDGSPLTWRLRDRRKPKSVRVSFTRRTALVDAGVVRVEREPEHGTFAIELRPVRSRGRIVDWDVVSEPVGHGDMALTLDVRWLGECGDEDAFADFRVMSR